MAKSAGIPFSLTLRVVAGLSFALVSGAAGAQNAPTLVPYTTKLVAGGGTAVYGTGAKCPSGLTSTDAYGDGCLATEIEIGNSAAGSKTPGSRSAAADSGGNVFFTDYNNGLVRRVDALTGIVTAVAGGAASNPASGAACGAYVSTDAAGDGCLSTAVKLMHPVSVAFAPNGDLYFSDVLPTSPYFGQVRKIAATNGLIATVASSRLRWGMFPGR